MVNDKAFKLLQNFNIIFFQLNGTACCSDTAISFHYISPKNLYVMYYLVYHLRSTIVLANHSQQ